MTHAQAPLDVYMGRSRVKSLERKGGVPRRAPSAGHTQTPDVVLPNPALESLVGFSR